MSAAGRRGRPGAPSGRQARHRGPEEAAALGMINTPGIELVVCGADDRPDYGRARRTLASTITQVGTASRNKTPPERQCARGTPTRSPMPSRHVHPARPQAPLQREDAATEDHEVVGRQRPPGQREISAGMPTAGWLSDTTEQLTQNSAPPGAVASALAQQQRQPSGSEAERHAPASPGRRGPAHGGTGAAPRKPQARKASSIAVDGEQPGRGGLGRVWPHTRTSQGPAHSACTAIMPP